MVISESSNRAASPPLDTEALLADLTDAQKAAVSHVDGPLLVVAGAGSGKTRVITRRVAYLIAQGIPAPSILAITFTNKAAGEMKERIGRLLDRKMYDFGKLEQRWPTVCTFHSLCLRILRHYAAPLGLPENFAIYDSSDQTRLIKDVLKTLEIPSTNFAPSAVHSTISNAKNQLLSPQAFAAAADNDFYLKNVARVYTKYQKMLQQNNALDFDDLLLRTAEAFRSHPDILQELQERFQYILIDEYQDTNHAQYIIAHALAMKNRNMCVVGDPDQSIYRWRGADIRNILDFEKDYPDAVVVRLEQNYRSTKTILKIASDLIARNAQRKDKRLWTENSDGEKAMVLLCQDEHHEAATIAQRLQRLHDGGKYPWSKMAVFYRINALSRVMEEALRRANIPYQIARGVEFYNRKEIKDVLAYLRVIANPADAVNLGRIVNVPPRGLGASSIQQLEAWGVSQGIGLWEAFTRASEAPGLAKRATASARQFVQLVQSWQQLAVHPPVGKKGRIQMLMEDVVSRSGLEAMLRKIGDKELAELANVSELINSAAEFDKDNPDGALVDYLAMVSLVSDADRLEGGEGAVTMMSLHAAKGLEFPVVAMIGMEEGILPHSRARDSRDDLEEERRLCFVGITRAQERLLFSKAARRTIRGLSERTITSPFIAEMPADALEVEDLADFSSPIPFAASSREQSSDDFHKGQLVRHPTFGLGRISDLSSLGRQTRVVVQFNSAGRKTLILEYARLAAAD